jgi:hypothetical protein
MPSRASGFALRRWAWETGAGPYKGSAVILVKAEEKPRSTKLRVGKTVLAGVVVVTGIRKAREFLDIPRDGNWPRPPWPLRRKSNR